MVQGKLPVPALLPPVLEPPVLDPPVALEPPEPLLPPEARVPPVGAEPPEVPPVPPDALSPDPSSDEAPGLQPARSKAKSKASDFSGARRKGILLIQGTLFPGRGRLIAGDHNS